MWDPITHSEIDPGELERRETASMRAMLAPDEFPLSKGIELRPLTLGTLALLRQTKNEFLTGTGGKLENEIFAALAFAYIHAAPLAEVRRNVWNENAFRDAVAAFGDEMPPEKLPALIAEILRRLADIGALQFETKPQPGTGKGPTPPGN